MSWQCTSWALREAPCPNASARLVLIALADRCQPDGRSAWPTIETLMREAHCSRATVKRALRDMESRGTIRRGDQSLARHDEHGRWLAPQWRPVVWECCMDVSLEKVSEKPGRQAEAERRERLESRGVKMSPQNIGASSVADDPARGVTGDPLIRKTNNYTNITNNPIPPSGDFPKRAGARRKTGTSSSGVDDALELCRRMAQTMRGEPRLPVPTALDDGNSGKPAVRELRAARRLVSAYGLDCCTAVAEWSLLPADNVLGSKRDGFWRRVVTGAVRLERRWDAIVAQMADDPKGARMLAAAGKGPSERHRMLTVSTPGARAVQVWGAGEFPIEESRTHIDGLVDTSQCPLCSFDTRNRGNHGTGLPRKQAAASPTAIRKEPVQYHFKGGEGYRRQQSKRKEAQDGAKK